MFGSNTCSAVTRTARALTASKGTLSVVASGRITPLPTKRTCGLVLVNSSLNSRMPMSVWPERLRIGRLERERDFAHHVFVEIQREQVAADARW